MKNQTFCTEEGLEWRRSWKELNIRVDAQNYYMSAIKMLEGINLMHVHAFGKFYYLSLSFLERVGPKYLKSRSPMMSWSEPI